jgi:signal transduction histidine kinase
MQSRIFQPFFTLKESGTGLGLPLAKKIAILHGGNLVLDHSSPSGTTFAVVLPVEAHVPVPPAGDSTGRDKALAFRH